MNPNITKIIDQYLAGELSAENVKVFEERLKTNPELQAEVDLQRSVMEGAQRAAQRSDISKVKKQYHFKKLLKWATIGIGAAALATTAVLFFGIPDEAITYEDVDQLSETLKDKLDKDAQIERLPIQYFQIPSDGGVVLSDKGVLISVPENAFMLNGKPYAGETVVQFQEAMNGGDILKSGLSTMSGDRLLETQGMFGVSGYTKDGKQLELNPEVGVYIQAPVNENKEGMQLFKGQKNDNGVIDWVDPEPLAKLPIPADMADLDFYPEKYEPYLDNIKWKKDKNSRDSLYLTFDYSACESEANVQQEMSEGERLFRAECATCHMVNKDGTGPKMKGVRQKWKNAGAKSDAIYKFVQHWQSAVYYDDYVHEVIQWSPAAMSNHKSLSEEQIDAIFDYADYGYGKVKLVIHNDANNRYTDTIWAEDEYAVEAVAYDSEAMPEFIRPSKVLAFWDKKFNNTNLATKDFEKRMRMIHETCNNTVLKKYTSQLDKGLSEIDAEIVAMGYSQFKSFAAENVGALNPDNPHIKGLQEFYKKGIEQLQNKAERNRKKEQKRRDKWDKEISEERSDELVRTAKRETQALVEEYEFNLENVKKQIGPSVGFTLKHGGGTIVNIDKYVWDATVARETTTITDPFTGKTAKITYNDFSVKVPNADKYIKLYAYLFPHDINSYQRIEHTNGTFDYPLNGDMIYDIGIVGVKEDGYDFFQKQTLNGGHLGTISMSHASEKEMAASINQLNKKRNARPMKIKDELQWLIKERADYKEQKMRKEMEHFRYQVAESISRCLINERVENEAYYSDNKK